MRISGKLVGLAVLLLCLIAALPVHAEETVFDPEDGVWTDEAGENVILPSGFFSGYLTVQRGHVIYRDANRREALGYPLEECAVYAKRVRTYEKGAVYQVRFDTAKTRDEKQCATGYYYTQIPEEADRPAAGRVLDGALIPEIRFHYGAETGAESRFNVVTASGIGYAAKPDTNLREGPGPDYSYVARLKKDTRVTITGFNTNNNVTWYYVYDEEGNRGFVRADLLTDRPSSAAPAEEPQPDPADPDAEAFPAEGENPEGEPGAEDGESAAEDGNPVSSKNPADAESGDSAQSPDDRENAASGEDPADVENPAGKEPPEEAVETAGTETATDEETAAPARVVRVALAWEKAGSEPVYGDRATLTAVLEGYDGVPCALQWQTSRDGTNWTDVPGAIAESLTVTMTEENSRDYWRVLVTADVPAREAGEPADDANALGATAEEADGG